LSGGGPWNILSCLDLDTPLDSGDQRQGLFAELSEIARDIWGARELLHQLVLRDIRLRYRQAVMGVAWAFLLPALTILAGTVVRYAIALVSGSSLDAQGVASIAVKAPPWAFFVASVNFATISLTMNIGLVTKIYFPREVLPLAATLVQGADSAVGAAAVALALPFMGVSPSLALLWVPALALLLFCFTAAVALLFSCANLFFRDVKYITQIVLTFGIFFTPVLFEPSFLGDRGAKLIMLNPIAPILEGLRLAVVEGHNLLVPLVTASPRGIATLAWDPWYLAYSAAWSLGGLVTCSLLFHRLQFLFPEYI
jgi:homopolymeric O-antigen transport system permease protein